MVSYDVFSAVMELGKRRTDWTRTMRVLAQMPHWKQLYLEMDVVADMSTGANESKFGQANAEATPTPTTVPVDSRELLATEAAEAIQVQNERLPDKPGKHTTLFFASTLQNTWVGGMG